MGRRRLHERRHGMGFARDESNEQRASEEMSGGGAVCTGDCQSAWAVKERSTELDCGQLMSRERRAIGERRLDGAVASLHRWGPRTHSVLDYCTTGRSFRAIASRRLCPVGMVLTRCGLMIRRSRPSPATQCTRPDKSRQGGCTT